MIYELETKVDSVFPGCILIDEEGDKIEIMAEHVLEATWTIECWFYGPLPE